MGWNTVYYLSRRSGLVVGFAVLSLTSTAWNRYEQRSQTVGEGFPRQIAEPSGMLSPVVENSTELGGIPTATQDANPAGVDPDWWGGIQKDIAESEYHIRWQDKAGAYQSPNRTQNLRFTYWGDGFSVEPRMTENPSWKLTLKLAAWGRDGAQVEFRPGELEVNGNRAKANGDGITLTYQNDSKGMRQDFLVQERPSGSGSLKLWLQIETNGVSANEESDGYSVMFGKAVSGGARVMSYGDLKVRDACGHLLRAEMVKKDEGQFAIVVDDSDAMYPLLVDPLSFSPDWRAEGNQTEAYFGSSVSTAGDVNDDGFSDVVVGAPFFDNGQPDEGMAFVYHGSPAGPASNPVWSAECDQIGAYFGWSVATAGDVNDDGFSDVIIGARRYDNGQQNEGRAYIYLGSASGLASTPVWTDESDQYGACFGWSVGTAGDVDDDGFSDVIVAAPFYENGETLEGRVYIYFGGYEGPSSRPDWIVECDLIRAYFGYSVATAGDVNGDGFSDVIVGAPYYDNDEIRGGRVFLYLGSSSGPATAPDWTAECDQTHALFGSSVATAGDVNGDGFSDVIIGANCYSNGESAEGRSFLYLGSSSGLSAETEWTAESNQNYAFFGYSVATAGDVNGDGFSDVIVGAPFYDNDQSDEGCTFVFLGNTSGLSTDAAWTAESDQDGARFGYSVATAGDVNGDGFSDVIIGADQYDNGLENEGRATIYMGNASGPAKINTWQTSGEAANDNFGVSLASAGDVNGDGFSDIIIGAHRKTDYTGKVYVYAGNESGLPATASWTTSGEAINNYFGYSVATAGDVNGDGFSDVVVGAYGNTSFTGKAYIYLGSPSGLSAASSWMAAGEAIHDNFAASVATAGDVNGDGFSDVVIGAYGNTDYTGKAYIYLGSTSGLSATPSWTAAGEATMEYFGVSVATAGDVNADGFSDVVIGAVSYMNGIGKAYVYLGSELGLSATASWTVAGEATNDLFGCSVATVGDINGDGFSDVAVGAGGGTGKAYVYLGSASGLSTTASLTVTGEATNDYFGYPVATAGDVNGDGFSDMIVGASRNADYTGKAYVYLGSASGLSAIPFWTASGEAINDYFGVSVATAGDVNGDGFSDVAVGALWTASLAGKAYLYCGNDSDGLHVLPRQWRPDLDTPVIPALKTRSQNHVGLGVLARTFFGRSDVMAQFEVKPLGTPFDGMGLVTTEWADAGAMGISVSEVIGGLSDRTMYKWRARIGYRLSDGAPQPFGRWIYQPYNSGLGEADFQVGDILSPDAPELHINALSESQYRLWWHPVAGTTSYNLYLGTFSFFIPGMPWQTVAAPDTSYDFTDGVGDPDTNYYFMCRSVGSAGESGDSNRVGEFDFNTPTGTINREETDKE